MIILVISGLLFALGAAFGSFLNVVIYRTISEESWVKGRSHCDSCQTRIAWYDNIPVVSYLILQARCRHCQAPIALSYPVVEFLTGVLFVWWYVVGSVFFQLTKEPFTTLQPIFWLGVGVLLLAIFFADLLYYLIPDVLVGALLAVTIAYRVALTFFGIMQTQDLLAAVMGCILAVGLIGGLWLITRGRGMGLGDVKLIAPIALLVGWPGIVVQLLLSFSLGAVVGIGLLLVGKRKFGQPIPFGPFLVVATVLTLVWGDPLLSWYWGQLQ